ncbi:MAG: tetratricopeptide repeat protein [Thermoanaerobaculia bacterium]
MALGAAALAPGRGAAAAEAGVGIELTVAVRQSLHRLQENWLQWVSAFYQDNAAAAAQSVEAMLATAHGLGMNRLVDLSVGAAARAVQSAADGNFERAHLALATAEKLDPGRPETEFARSRVARLEGSYAAAIAASVRGYQRIFSTPAAELWWRNAVLWGIAVLLLASALFVLVEAAMKGSAVYLDLEGRLAKRFSPPVAHLLALVVVFWPLALPGGPIFLLLFWSLLLFGYLSASERVVTGGIWLLLGLAPFAVAAEERQIGLLLSPPMRAIANLEQERFYGGLFSDLQVLRGMLPEEPAVVELFGDVHRGLGQWEYARLLYRNVIEREPENRAALINLGAHYFRRGEFATAVDYFRRASSIQPPIASAFYDLSQAYSESYQFEESKQALSQAKALDPDAVDRWMGTPQGVDRLLTLDGGLARRDEIRERLRAAWRESPTVHVARIEAIRRWAGLAVVGLVAAAAGVLWLLRRKSGYSEPVSWLSWRSNGFSRWLRALLPPLSAAELGEGFPAFGGILLLAALGMLPWVGRVGVDLGLGIDSGGLLPSLAALVAFSVYLALRVRAELAQGD